MLVKVLDEVGLRLQLPLELDRLHETDGPLLAFLDLGSFHLSNIGTNTIIIHHYCSLHFQFLPTSRSIREIRCGKNQSEAKRYAGVLALYSGDEEDR